MDTSVEITVGGETIGDVRFVDPGEHFSIARTVSGFHLELPVILTLRRTLERKRFPLLTGLRAIFTIRAGAGQGMELCRPACDQMFKGTCSNCQCSLRWSGRLDDLAVYEKLRECMRPSFNVTVLGDVAFLRDEAGEALKFDTAPETFMGHGTVEYSPEIWAKALRTLGISETIMIQIPLPAVPPNGWEEVWVELSNARAALERGGTTALRDAAVAVRRALEEWRKLETEGIAHGKQLKDRSKRERLDDLRLHLKNFADFAAHTGIQEWSRDDVVLMISTLAALVAVRNP
jgi:hypothetical protein